ncbi:MAG: D-alanyl-D-alanine carboxypeptidase family protein [Cyanobacteria bacterium P01_D01_bin.156]
MANFTDDIPEARRETLVAQAEPSAQSSSSTKLWLLGVPVIFGVAIAGFWWFRSGTSIADSSEPLTAAVAAETTDLAPDTTAESDTESLLADTNESVSLLGHRSYDVADPDALVAIVDYPMVRLKPEVAQKVEAMLSQSAAEGVSLGVISGFRSLEDQQYLFFDLKAERGQNTQTRAEVSAPPGYSEHHTGYAVDFVDMSQPATELDATFEQTRAFRWLEENAAYYGFEMSFPKENNQNVAYEPWHWRYVGNQESLELFYQD